MKSYLFEDRIPISDRIIPKTKSNSMSPPLKKMTETAKQPFFHCSICQTLCCSGIIFAGFDYGVLGDFGGWKSYPVWCRMLINRVNQQGRIYRLLGCFKWSLWILEKNWDSFINDNGNPSKPIKSFSRIPKKKNRLLHWFKTVGLVWQKKFPKLCHLVLYCLVHGNLLGWISTTSSAWKKPDTQTWLLGRWRWDVFLIPLKTGHYIFLQGLPFHHLKQP